MATIILHVISMTWAISGF